MCQHLSWCRSVSPLACPVERGLSEARGCVFEGFGCALDQAGGERQGMHWRTLDAVELVALAAQSRTIAAPDPEVVVDG